MVLGSGQYSVEIAPTGFGASRQPADSSFTQNIQSLRWNRKIDGTSMATINLFASPDCFSDLCRVQSIVNEARILRNQKIIWEGVIVIRKANRRRVQLIAFDLSWWFQRRFIPGGVLVGEPLDVAAVLEQAITAGFSQLSGGSPMDPAVLAGLETTDTGLVVAPVVNQASYRLVSEEVRLWAQTQLDWTMIRRQFRAGDPPVPVQLPDITADDIIGDPEITERGDLYATDVVVIGGNGDVGIASVEGVLGIQVPAHLRSQMREVVEAVNDPAALQSIAENLVRVRYPAPIEISLGSSAALSPKSQLDVDRLIPGARTTLDLAGFCAARTTQESELVQVEGTVTSKGEAIGIDTRPLVSTSTEGAAP